MTKVSIEIEDIKNERMCLRAFHQLFKTIVEHHGEETAESICRSAIMFDLSSPVDWAIKQFDDVLCAALEPEDFRSAFWQLCEIIARRYGKTKAKDILLSVPLNYAVHLDRSSESLAEKKFVNACYHFSLGDFRLLLEHYSMPKPNKQKLTIDCARKNEALSRDEQYGARGTQNPGTMLKQLNRILKDERCNEIAAFTPGQREEARKIIVKRQRMNSEIRRHEERKAEERKAARRGQRKRDQ